MFRLFKRRSPDAPQVSEQEAEVLLARDLDRPMGRLTDDAVSAPRPEAPPEYIAEAATPSEEAWAHEEELYREKNEEEQD